jgi:hypothetical protein
VRKMKLCKFGRYAKQNCANELSTQKETFVQILQSHFIPTMSHWSSGLPVCFLSQGT